jgi:hypothetical protein
MTKEEFKQKLLSLIAGFCSKTKESNISEYEGASEDLENEIESLYDNIEVKYSLDIAKELLKYDYTKLMSGKWSLSLKDSNASIIRKDSEQELIDYVVRRESLIR